MDRSDLEGMDRESLIARAQDAGIRRARILTRPELVDELLRLDPAADAAKLAKSRGFFGRARDLVARVVERGLHLPDAADRIRTFGTLPPSVPRTDPQAMPTVTLAEIYAAQGHKTKAIETLRRVLEREPDHVAARMLLARLEDAAYVAPPPPLPPEQDEPDVAPSSVTGDPEEALADAPTPEPEDPADDVGACVAIPLDGGRMYVKWQLRKGTRRSGRFVVRALVVEPSWDGPKTETRDLAIDADTGEAMLENLPEGSVVRVAVGFCLEDGGSAPGSTFVPVLHSPALEAAKGAGLVLWSVSGVSPVLLDDPRAAFVARAASDARKAALA